MVEGDLHREVIAGFTTCGIWVWKWPDSAKGVKKPFDLCMTVQGTFCPIEAKLRKYERAKPLTAWDPAVNVGKDFEPHQLDTMLKIDLAGGKPLILLGVVIKQPLQVHWTKSAWLLSLATLHALTGESDVVTVGQLNKHHMVAPLEWKPTVGWLFPDRFRFD